MSTTQNERPTPITDAVWRKHTGFSPQSAADAYELAGNLERRLSEVRDNLDIERERADDAGLKWKQATEALAEVSEQRDKLAEALVGLIPTNARPMECDSPQLKAAHAALAAVKGGKP